MAATTQSKANVQREKERKAAAGKKEAEKKAAAEKREQKREERETAKAAERKEQIKSGALIEGPGEVEFHQVDKSGKDATLDNRAEKVLADLQKATTTPVLGKDLMDKHGGSWALYIPMFSILKAQGQLREYRRRTGERGGSGVAYLWIG